MYKIFEGVIIPHSWVGDIISQISLASRNEKELVIEKNEVSDFLTNYINSYVVCRGNLKTIRDTNVLCIFKIIELNTFDKAKQGLFFEEF